MSLGPLTRKVLMIGTSTRRLSPWMYTSSSTPWSCTASMIPDPTRSAITRGSSSTNTPTLTMDGDSPEPSSRAASPETHLRLGR